MSFWENALFDLDWPKSWIWKKLRETETHFWKSIVMALSKHFKWKYLATKKFKFHARNLKCQIRNCQFGTFDSVHGIWKLLFPNIFIWSVLKAPLLYFFEDCFFQIQDLGQSRSKSPFSQKDTCLSFLFLFPSVLLSC